MPERTVANGRAQGRVGTSKPNDDGPLSAFFVLVLLLVLVLEISLKSEDDYKDEGGEVHSLLRADASNFVEIAGMSRNRNAVAQVGNLPCRRLAVGGGSECQNIGGSLRATDLAASALNFEHNSIANLFLIGYKGSREEEKKGHMGNDEKCQPEKGPQPSPQSTIISFFMVFCMCKSLISRLILLNPS